MNFLLIGFIVSVLLNVGCIALGIKYDIFRKAKKVATRKLIGDAIFKMTGIRLLEEDFENFEAKVIAIEKKYEEKYQKEKETLEASVINSLKEDELNKHIKEMLMMRKVEAKERVVKFIAESLVNIYKNIG